MKRANLKRPKVSFRALVGHLERQHGMDVEAVCQEILNPEVRAAIAAGARTITINDTTYQIAENIVTAAQDPALRPGRGPTKTLLSDARAAWQTEHETADDPAEDCLLPQEERRSPCDPQRDARNSISNRVAAGVSKPAATSCRSTKGQGS